MSLKKVYERHISFHRSYVEFGAGVTGALMLSQAVYWASRTSDPDGWFYKTQQEWEEETGLSRYEQEGARKKLIAAGVMQEKKVGVPCRLFYRADLATIHELLTGTQYAENPQTRMQQTSRQEAVKPADIHTEITTETTNKKKPAKAGFDPSEGRPGNVSADVWEGFCKMRKAKRATLTERACQLIAKKLIGLSQEQADEVVDRSTSNSWTDVYAEKAGGTKQQPVSSTRPPLKEGQFYHPEWDAGQRVICHVDKHDPETGYPRSLF